MNDNDDQALWDEFFSIGTIGELRLLAANLDHSVPVQSALAYYISTWHDLIGGDDGSAFFPGTRLSRDRSAIFYGNAPVIFDGTNKWCVKPHLSADELFARTRGLRNSVTSVRDANPHSRITLLLVPEKDHILSRFMRNETRFAALDEAIGRLSADMKRMEVAVVFDQPFRGLDSFMSLADFEYKDTHLAGRLYVTIFGFVIASLGLDWPAIREAVSMSRVPEIGDLAGKFDNSVPAPVLGLQPDVPSSAVVQTAGSETFASPLGDTWQEFTNSAALVDRSVCLLGDSHCSIYAQRKLTYLFAGCFRQVHFEWNPCGIRKPPDLKNPDYILLEMSSRFAV